MATPHTVNNRPLRPDGSMCHLPGWQEFGTCRAVSRAIIL